MVKQWRYESAGGLSPWPRRVVVITAVVVPLLALATVWGLGLFNAAIPLARSPHQLSDGRAIAPLVEHPGRHWQAYRREQRQRLNSTAWRSEDRAVARVPVSEAMTTFLETQRTEEEAQGAEEGR